MRDDFSKKTIDTLAKRVGYLCSNPDCRTQTVGPAQSHIGAVIVGVAAHITAAAPGGPRFDASLTAEERRDQSNGIWLCQIHGKQVDSDSGHFTAEMLLSWKQDAEQEAFEAITALNATGDRRAALMAPDDEDRPIIEGLGLSPSDNLQSVTANLLAAAKNDLAALKRMPGWPEHALALDLKMVDRNDTHAFNVSGLAAVIETFNEIVVIAAPGTGKTTTLLQLADTLLEGGISVATYVPLSEWSSRPDSLLQTFTRRRAFQNFREQHFMLLAHSGRLVLILDGWNELDPVSRKRATGEIKSLLRDLPDLRIIVSTRQQALDVPISGPIVKIHALAESQQLEIARALRGSQGEAVLDHAWRTPGLRELVAIPLYLTALISRTSGGSLPTTKEEVLRLFVAEHEQDGDKAEALRKELFGLHQ